MGGEGLRVIGFLANFLLRTIGPASEWARALNESTTIMLLPIETHTFVLTRLRYLSAAATSISGFNPDAKPAGYCADQVELAEEAFDDLLGVFNAANSSHGEMTVAFHATHDACVAVYACMKSLYRTDLAVSQSIRMLPTQDQSPGRTLARGKAVDALWGTLPNVPGTTAPMVVGEITAASFGAMVLDLDGKITAAKLAASNYAGALAEFHEQLADWNDFTSAGRAQGQAIYKEGTGPRAILDRIPVAPSTQPPEQAEITTAASPAAGAAQLAFAAKHGTSFEVWQKGPGEKEFKEVADVLRPGEYTATGLPAGAHEYYVVPVNSRGKGPASQTASVVVAAVQAA